jgi:hypothetical protein
MFLCRRGDRCGGTAQVTLEGVEPPGPVGPVRLEPRVELHQRFWTESVEPPLRILPDLLQPGLGSHDQLVARFRMCRWSWTSKT